MKNNDFDFINEKFNEAQINVPNELDKKVEAKLEKATPKIIKFGQKAWMKTTISLVASLAVFISALTFINSKAGDKPVIPTVSKTPTASAFTTFESYDELKKYVKNNTDDRNYTLFSYGEKSSDALEYTVDQDSTEVADNSNAQTYIQELGVDEADIIKTYKGYIFVATEDYSDASSDYLSVINVIKTNGDSAENVHQIQIKKGYSAYEIYVYNDTLVVISSKLYSNYKGVNDNMGFVTMAEVYDISNPEKPKSLHSFEQSGSYISSRMIGDNLYLVTNYGIRYSKLIVNEEEYAPYVCKDDGKREAVACTDIAYQEGSTSNEYVVASAFDVKKNKQTGTTKAMIGWGADVYCSLKNLYVYSNEYFGAEAGTAIAKLSLDNGVEFVNKATVKGSVESQYSFSERNGKLCVFTTANNYDEDGIDKNYLYVLNEDLKEIYKSKAFAETESIKTVKYIGNYAYVITYEQTDPLFVIDLSNVEKPVFMGEVKISGFSEMLVDVGDNMLLGIGQSTHYGKEVDMEVTDGLKLALFDVSNPSEPKVLDSKTYRGYTSDTFYNPKALTVNKNDGTYSIPFFNDYGKAGALIISVKDKEIKENLNRKFDTDGYNIRVSFVDDFYYFVDVNQGIAIPFQL